LETETFYYCITFEITHKKLFNELDASMLTSGLADLDRMPQYGRQFLLMIPTTYGRRNKKKQITTRKLFNK